MLFYEGRRLLEKWQKNTPENFYYLCLIHLSSLEINFNMLVNAADISLKERLDFMEQLLQNPVYLEYIEMFPEERKKAFEAKINLTLEKLGQAFGQNILLFYQYHFGRIYLGQKWIMENRSGFYEIALYVVSFLSKHHILAYESELLNLGVSFLTGESCVSLEQARYIMEQYIKSEGNLLEEKELLWRSSQQNNTERALLYLTIADELYPDNQEIKEKINRCFV